MGKTCVAHGGATAESRGGEPSPDQSSSPTRQCVSDIPLFHWSLPSRLAESVGYTVKTILLLTISNLFMTFAWYGHLKYKEAPLLRVILISWFIAFFEYCFQVPANRIGHYQFSAAELKTIQEVITLLVFAVFSIAYLGEPLKWNYLVGFICIIAAVFFVFHTW
jgi:uncharacterized protein (DUF486 family)